MVTGPDGLYTDHLQAAIEMVRWPRSPCSRNDGASSQAASLVPCPAWHPDKRTPPPAEGPAAV
jgi:hypothetical protein